MESPYFLLIALVLSIIVLVCFFILCSNVSKLVKLANDQHDDYAEYIICLKTGENEKAFYHLKRALAKDQQLGIGQIMIDDYIKKFESLGLGIPDMDILKK